MNPSFDSRQGPFDVDAIFVALSIGLVTYRGELNPAFHRGNGEEVESTLKHIGAIVTRLKAPVNP